MVDIVTPAKRSQMMAGIQSRNTKPELTVRRMLHGSGYRFRLHRRDLPGVPDIVMPGRKVAIFVHGCFWHQHVGCRHARMPATRPDFWQSKLQANVERDRHAVGQLRILGWRVLCVWECSTRNAGAVATLQAAMGAWIEGGESFGEIGAPSRS